MYVFRRFSYRDATRALAVAINSEIGIALLETSAASASLCVVRRAPGAYAEENAGLLTRVRLQ